MDFQAKKWQILKAWEVILLKIQFPLAVKSRRDVTYVFYAQSKQPRNVTDVSRRKDDR